MPVGKNGRFVHRERCGQSIGWDGGCPAMGSAELNSKQDESCVAIPMISVLHMPKSTEKNQHFRRHALMCNLMVEQGT